MVAVKTRGWPAADHRCSRAGAHNHDGEPGEETLPVSGEVASGRQCDDCTSHQDAFRHQEDVNSTAVRYGGHTHLFAPSRHEGPRRRRGLRATRTFRRALPDQSARGSQPSDLSTAPRHRKPGVPRSSDLSRCESAESTCSWRSHRESYVSTLTINDYNCSSAQCCPEDGNADRSDAENTTDRKIRHQKVSFASIGAPRGVTRGVARQFSPRVSETLVRPNWSLKLSGGVRTSISTPPSYFPSNVYPVPMNDRVIVMGTVVSGFRNGSGPIDVTPSPVRHPVQPEVGANRHYASYICSGYRP
jgi:hypothetical protein